MSELVKYNRKPDFLSEETVTTVLTIAEKAGKSITTLYNTILLLKPVSKIQDVISSGKLPVISEFHSRPEELPCAGCPVTLRLFRANSYPLDLQ